MIASPISHPPCGVLGCPNSMKAAPLHAFSSVRQCQKIEPRQELTEGIAPWLFHLLHRATLLTALPYLCINCGTNHMRETDWQVKMDAKLTQILARAHDSYTWPDNRDVRRTAAHVKV